MILGISENDPDFSQLWQHDSHWTQSGQWEIAVRFMEKDFQDGSG